jgi:hypothetical protein
MCNATKDRAANACRRGSARAASACHCTDSPLRQKTALFHPAGRSASVPPRTGRAGALFLMVLFCAGAWADEDSGTTYPQVWISPGIYSHHFDPSKNLRNDNPGPGIEFAAARNHVYQAGSYINSVRARTYYAFYAYRPLHWQVGSAELSAGIALGAFNGYSGYRDGAWFVAPLPILSIEGRRLGVNMSIIPTIENRLDGAFSIQVKLRVW